MRPFILCCVISIRLMAGVAFGQTASITGLIKDQTGAVLPGATVLLVNVETGIQRTTLTNDEGYYTLQLLQPGDYRISVQATGFKPIVRSGIKLEVQQIARIDFAMELGELTQEINVTGAAPLLEQESSSLGEVIQGRKVEDLPLNGRNPLALVALVPGVVPQGLSQVAPAVPNFYAFGNFQISGALGNQSEMTWDGAILNGPLMNGIRFVPTADSIEEFRVQTNNLSAEFGRSAGGIVSVVTKSGTNEFHGSAYEFLRNKVLNANTFFNNARGVERPDFTQNQYGATFGGRIIRDKTFFFTSFEGFRLRQGRSEIFTVPTLKMLAGDFSEIGRNVYDPLTTRPDPANPGQFIRDPFPGNIIPRERIDTVAAQYVAQRMWALPNSPGAAFNWAGNTKVRANSEQFTARLDHMLGEKQKILGRYSIWKAGTPGPFAFNNGLIVQDQSIFPDFRQTQQAVLEDVYSFSPNTIADFRFSYMRFGYDRRPGTQGQDLTALGLPANLNVQIPTEFRHVPNAFPTGFAFLWGGSVIFQAEDVYQVVANLSSIRGRHRIKFGIDFRPIRLNYTQSNDTTGAFTANGLFTAIDPLRPAGTGHSFADFMLGYPNSGQINTPARLAQQRFYRAFYFHDDIHVTSTLTLNLGVRYDQDGGWSERFDRQSFFMPDAEHPLTAETGLPLVGRLGLVNSPDRESRLLADTFLGQIAPRFGFAYQLSSKLVVRGGYGIFWLPKTIARREVVAEATGFRTTLFVSSLDGQLTPLDRLSNPFPGGVLQPVGRDPIFQELLTGQSFRSTFPDEYAYSQQWNFNVQHELPGDLLIDAAYAGLKGTRLPLPTVQLNQLPVEFLSLGSGLNAQVPNPFLGLISSGPLSRPTVARGQLLRPFPHYSDVLIMNPFAGSSTYHSMQLKVEKRFRGGSGLLGSYTISKLITDAETLTTWLEAGVAGYQNFHNRRAERSISSQDVPQRLVLSYALDLPFGRGRRFLGGASGGADKLISGWAVNGIYTLQDGNPIFLSTATNLTNSFGGGSRPNNNGQSAELTGSAKERLNRWFDTSVFTQPPAFTFGNVSRTLPDVRTHGINNFDFSIFKNTYFGPEARLNLQFRAEFFNLFNRTNFGTPGQTLGTPQFGIVSSQRNEPRLVQFALKFVF
jgi:Carboxypeptidase regulatory-like domain